MKFPSAARPPFLLSAFACCLVLAGLPQALGAERAWRPIGISGGGAMFTPAISPANPDLIMLNCDMSGAYLSENGGGSWRMINQAQLRSDTACRPAFHPTDQNTIFASSSGALRVSHDRGRTFSAIGNLPDSLGGEIAINPDDPRIMLAGSRPGRCWISRDAGRAWSPCAGPSGRVVGFHFARARGGGRMLAATVSGIWRSDDGGQSWTEKTRGLPWKEVQGFAGASDATGGSALLYCSVRSKIENGAFAGGIHLSRDVGENWEPVPGQGLNKETAKADEWAYGPVSQYHQILAANARPRTVYALNTSTGFHPPHSDTVYRSDDAGATWRAVYFQDPRFAKYNVAPDWETASCGQSFKGGDAPFGAAICDSDPDRLVLVRETAHITRDGGGSWIAGQTAPAARQTPGPNSAWLCNGLVVTTTWHFYTDPFDTNRQYICYTDIGMARSTNAGQSWIWWNPKTWSPWRNTCFEMAFDPDTPGKIWGAFSDVHDIPNDNIIGGWHNPRGPGGVCLSRDFGASWKAAGSGLPVKPVTSVALDPRSPKGARTLYAGVFDDGVYKTTDDGKTWEPKNNGLGDAKNMRVYRIILHRDGALFAVICGKRVSSGQPLMREGVGLYRSTNGAESWEKINSTQPLLYLKDFSADSADSRRLLLGAADSGGGDQSGGLYLTEDAGRNWRRIGREGSQTFGGYFHPKRPKWIYMTLTEGAPGAGLWLSRDGGESWKPFDELPFSNVQRVEFDPADDETIRVTTFGGGVWVGPAAPAKG